MINFPDSPTLNQVFQGPNGVSYTWNGTLWLVQNTFAGGSGDFCAVQFNTGIIPTTAAVLIPVPVITGNSGVPYNTANGRYTPPAGRYLISAWYSASSSSATLLTLILRKNGAVLNQSNVQTSSVGIFSAEPSVTAIVDASGSDFFDIQGVSSVGNGTILSLVFQASPLTGMQGPAGVQPTGGGIIREVTLASPAATIDLFSLGVKTCTVFFRFAMGAANQTVFFNVAVGSTVDVSNNYTVQQMYTTGSTVSGSLSAASTQITLTNADTGSLGMVGTLSIPDISLTKYLADFHTTLGGNHYLFKQAFLLPGGSNGFRFSTSGTFAAGSFVRVIGWP